jgi:hypothetical protein
VQTKTRRNRENYRIYDGMLLIPNKMLLSLFSRSRGTGEVSMVWVVPRLGSAGGMVVHPVTGGEINNMG